MTNHTTEGIIAMLRKIVDTLGEMNNRLAALEARCPTSHIAYLLLRPDGQPWTSDICLAQNWPEIESMYGDSVRQIGAATGCTEAVEIALAAAVAHKLDATHGWA